MICKGETGISFQFPSAVIINNISLFEVQDFFYLCLLHMQMGELSRQTTKIFELLDCSKDTKNSVGRAHQLLDKYQIFQRFWIGRSRQEIYLFFFVMQADNIKFSTWTYSQEILISTKPSFFI